MLKFLQRLYYELQFNTISIRKAAENAYHHLGPDYTPEYAAFKTYYTEQFGTLSFASWYKAKFGTKGADLQHERLKWVAQLMAHTIAFNELPPIGP